MGLDEAIQLFHDHQGLYGSGKITDLLLRQRPDHTQLHHRVLVTADLFHILIRGGRSDDTHGAVSTLFNAVDFAGLSPLHQLPGTLFHNGMAQLGIAGHHDVLLGILFVGLGDLNALTGLHHTLGVGDTGTHLNEHRGVELLRQIVSQLGKCQSFCRIRRL